MNFYNLDGHKMLWHLERVNDWLRGMCIAPIYLEISPVSYCNQHCTHCGIDFARTRRNRIDTAVLLQALGELAESGVKSIMFAGEGEPLLHEDLDKIVARTSASGIDVAITTNGSIGNDEMWRSVFPHLTWLRFSIDAAEAETYAAIHGVDKGVFDIVLNNVKTAVLLKNSMDIATTIGIQIVVLNENFSELEHAVQRYSDIGVDYISFKPFSRHPQMIQKKDIVYTNEMLEYLQQLEQRCSSGHATVICRSETFLNAIRSDITFEHCFALPFAGYIDATGEFYTCSIALGDTKFSAGNIHSTSITSILRGGRREESIRHGREYLSVKEHCRVNCRMARINEFLEQLTRNPAHVNFI